MQKVPVNPVYLDTATTTPIHPEILKDMALINKTYFENADSLHFGGQRVSDLVAQSRKALAQYFKVLPHEVIFTSGASESNSAAIKGIAFANQDRGKHIITSSIEHASVLESVRQLVDHFGFEATYLPVNHKGQVSSSDLLQALRKDTVLVSIMAVNNEVGSIQDIESLVKVVKKNSSAYFHTDAVQSLAKHDFPLQQIDAVTYSAHKINGLKGSGLLILRSGVPFLPLINGGQQEGGRRGGTTDNASAILFAKTLRLALESYHKHHEDVLKMQSYIYDYFKDDEDITFNSSIDQSPYIINFSVENVGSEIMMNGLNSKGYAISAQSTCNSKSNKASHVLKSMGISDKATFSTIRISLSHDTSLTDIKALCSQIMEIKNYAKHTV